MDEIKSPSFKPLYQQVKELMLMRLTHRTWAPGDILPSEGMLAAEFGVSQGTVRKALDELTAENLLIRSQGRGTFVAEHTTNRSLFHFLSLVDRENEKQIPQSRLISMMLDIAHADEQLALNLDRGEKVVRINRNRYLKDRPVITEQITVPSRLTPGLENFVDDLPNTLYQLYEKHFGFSVTRASEWLSAISVSAFDAQQLDVDVGSPVLCIERLAYTFNAQPVELRRSICHTENHRYLSELT